MKAKDHTLSGAFASKGKSENIVQDLGTMKPTRILSQSNSTSIRDLRNEAMAGSRRYGDAIAKEYDAAKSVAKMQPMKHLPPSQFKPMQMMASDRKAMERMKPRRKA